MNFMNTKIKQKLRSTIPPKWLWRLQRNRIRQNLVHLHGPQSIPLQKDQAVVTCVVRNGAYFIDSFIQHYQAMGFAHIFFMDNGSSDATIEIAKSYRNVSISRSTLPINSYQRLFKRYLAERSGKGGWCLDADIDELFDYPLSDAVDLQSFLSYLNDSRYTAVITQMLDMFAKTFPPSSDSRGDLQRLYTFYDLSAVRHTDYGNAELVRRFASANTVDSAGAELLWGGIREALYGNHCLLTKHSLFYPAAIEAFPHIHMVNGARVADVSGILLHYKLTANAMEMAIQNRDHFTQNSDSYGAFVEVLKKQQLPNLNGHSAKRFVNVQDLEKERFVRVPRKYREYAASLQPLQSSEAHAAAGLSR